MLLWLIHLWLGPLPTQEIFPEKKPSLLLHWFIHPLKRRIAKYYLFILQQFFGLKVIAITGSAGKTTTKNLLYCALSSQAHTSSTANNTTSTYNIPTTILKTNPFTKYLILEMSVEYPGDMDFYTWLARPDIAIFLNVASVHTTYLKDLTGVANEKKKIFNKLPSDGAAIINSDEPLITPPANAKSYAFGHSPDAFCQIISSKLTNQLTTEIKLITNQQPTTYNLQLLGEHYASNLSAVVTTAYLLGIDPQLIVSPLSQLKPTPRRFNPLLLPNGTILIDDTHNANPKASEESLKTFVQLAKLKHLTPLFVFAQMNELGDIEKSAHISFGSIIKNLGIKNLYCLGPATKLTIKSARVGNYYSTQESLINDLKKKLTSKTKYLVLVKGSRSWHMENVVQKLTSAFDQVNLN